MNIFKGTYLTCLLTALTLISASATSLHSIAVDTLIPSIDTRHEFCIVDSLLISVDSLYAEISWSTGDTTQSIYVKEAGIYSVTVVDESGDWGEAAQEIDDFILKEPAIDGSPLMCDEDTQVLRTNEEQYEAYQWFLPNGSSLAADTTNQLLIDTAGMYVLRVEDEKGCTAYDSLRVAFHDSLDVYIKGPDAFCQGSQAIITADTSLLRIFRWFDNDTINVERIIFQEGEYTLTGVDTNECQIESSYKANFFTPIDLDSLFNGDTLICEGGSTFISVNTDQIKEFTWADGSTKDSLFVEEAGEYLLNGVDSNNCSFTASFRVDYFETKAIEIIGDLFICEDGSTVLSVDTSDLIGFMWNDGNTVTEREIDEVGIYSVSATDVNGCTVFGEVEISYFETFDIPIRGDSTLCPGQVGKIFLDQGIYNDILWEDTVVGDTLLIVTPGEYKVEAKDANGCFVEGYIEILETEELDPEIKGDKSICPGQVSTLMVEDDFDSYTWNTGEETRVLQITEAGLYSVTVTDKYGCSGETSVIVEAGSFEAPSITGDEFICIGGSTTLSIDEEDYSNIVWNTFETGASITVAESGTYIVSATDEEGCSGSSSFTVFNYPETIVNITGDTELCKDGSGSLFIDNPSVISVEWDDGSTDFIREISECDRNYTLGYIDLNNCEYITQIEVGCFDDIDIILLNKEDVRCHNGSDGLLAVEGEVNNQNGFFFYEWSNQSSNQLINNLSEGEYTVTVSDLNNCSAEASFIIEQPSPITFEVLELREQTCFYTTDNEVRIAADGGVGNFRYRWLNETVQNTLESQFLPGDSVTQLPLGMYDIEVIDQNMCLDTFALEMTGPDSIILTQAKIDDVLCNGENTGAFNLIANGGIGSLAYQWTHGQNGRKLDSLFAGTYTVNIIDDLECTITETFEIEEPSAIEIEAVIENESLNGAADGSIEISITGGTGDSYTIMWEDGSNSNTLTDLIPGEYTVMVSDEEACIKTATFLVSAGNCMLTALLTPKNVSCFGESNGEIDISLTNLIPPYRVWVNDVLYADAMGNTEFNQTQLTIPNLTVGTYELAFQDVANCTYAVSTDIFEPNKVLLELLVDVQPSCLDSETGRIVSNTFGQEIQSYEWSNGAVTPNIDNIAPGDYSLTVTDLNECSAFEQIAVEHFDNIAPELVLQGLTIYLDADGNVSWPLAEDFDLASTDNCSDISFNYDQPTTFSCESTDSLSVTIAGRDSEGNVDIGESYILIRDTIRPQILLDTIRISSCDTVDLIVSMQDFTDNCAIAQFNWTNPQVATGPFPEGISQLEISVADISGNMTTKEIVILNEVRLDVDYTVFHPTCFGFDDGEIVFEPDGTNPPFKVTYDETIDIENMTAGIFTFTVNDKTKCERVLEIELDEPPLLEFTLLDFNNEVDDGFVEIDLFGGTPPYGFIWEKDGLLYSNDQNIYDLPAGEYIVTMLDSKGCTIISDPFLVGISSSVDHQEENWDVKLYPNPAQDMLYIHLSESWNNAQDIRVRLCTNQGQGIHEQWFSGHEKEIQWPLQELPQGMYYMIIESVDGREVRSFIKLD